MKRIRLYLGRSRRALSKIGPLDVCLERLQLMLVDLFLSLAERLERRSEWTLA